MAAPTQATDNVAHAAVGLPAGRASHSTIAAISDRLIKRIDAYPCNS
jgi:hypothetical protein